MSDATGRGQPKADTWPIIMLRDEHSLRTERILPRKKKTGRIENKISYHQNALLTYLTKGTRHVVEANYLEAGCQIRV